jgi:hypothetical protein
MAVFLVSFPACHLHHQSNEALEVENQLFKVHRHFLIEGSEVFRDMFAHAGGTGTGKNSVEDATEGTTDDWPIPLPDVTVEEFEVLLQCFYG